MVLLVQFLIWFKIQNVFGLSPKITFFRFTNNLATSGCDDYCLGRTMMAYTNTRINSKILSSCQSDNSSRQDMMSNVHIYRLLSMTSKLKFLNLLNRNYKFTRKTQTQPGLQRRSFSTPNQWHSWCSL
jgi:hypothetical protein